MDEKSRNTSWYRFATRYPKNINWQIWNRLSVLSFSAWKYQFS
jgi:hypothetical protein